MPANLTPQYRRAEAAYRQAASLQEELSCLQGMLREMPKHKGTNKLQGELKSKIAKIKAEVQNSTSCSASAKTSTRLPKQGAGRVVLIGAPNAGKSQLLASLTSAQPSVATFPFTTQTPTPGMMFYEDCPFQLIDLPAITQDFICPATMELVRGADMAFLVVDLSNDHLVEETEAVLARFEFGKTRLGRACMLDASDIGVSYTQTTVVFNKCDATNAGERLQLLDEFLNLPFERLEVSATKGIGLDALRTHVFERLKVVRVYTKHPQQSEPDMTHPFVVRQGDTLVEVAENVHRDVAAKLKSARIWGTGHHPGTTVNPDYQPQDGDIVELHVRG